MQSFFISACILCETAVQNIRYKIDGTATRLGTRDSSLFQRARRALKPTASYSRVPQTLFAVLKRPGPEADNPSPSSAVVNNTWK